MNDPFDLPGTSFMADLREKVAEGFLPRGHISGLTLANDATDATNDISVSAGVARSEVNAAYSDNNGPSTLPRHQVDLEIPRALIKQLDVAWTPGMPGGGGRSGGRSSSSLANGTWHVNLIGGAGMRPDVLLHDSATQSSVLAALPAGYTTYRRIGSILRESAAIVAFTQFGERFDRTTSVLDANDVTSPGTARTQTLSVPTGVTIIARVMVWVRDDNGARSTYGLVSALDQTSESAAQGNAISESGGGTLYGQSAIHEVKTNTSAQIRVSATVSDANVHLFVRTRGWLDYRGRFD